MTNGPHEDLPFEDRVRCFLDELTLGTSVVELTDDGPRRLDPTEVVHCHD